MNTIDLAALRKSLNQKQTEFSKNIGIVQSYLSELERGIKPLTEDVYKNLVDKFGEEYISKFIKKENDNISKGETKPYTTTKNGIEYYKFGNKFMMKVPFVPVHAYARYIDEYRDAEIYEGADYFYFPVDQVYHGKYRAFEIKGDSMDNDTKRSLSNGDVVLGRELSCDLWKSPLHINDYPNWIIVLDNTIICKQIIKHDIDTGEIICHSLNSDPAYADFSINLNDVRELYNIIMVTRTF